MLCVVLLALLSGCLRRQGRNDQCHWPDEEGRILNLHNAADQDHLRDDSQFAEELAVRYADRFRRKDGFAESRQRVAECRGALFANIAAIHNVDVQTVSQAALQRNRMADFVLVYLPMGILFVLFTYRQSGSIFLRLRTDSIVSAVIVVLIKSILVSGCGVLIGEIGQSVSSRYESEMAI
jgi:hypothetical protein